MTATNINGDSSNRMTQAHMQIKGDSATSSIIEHDSPERTIKRIKLVAQPEQVEYPEDQFKFENGKLSNHKFNLITKQPSSPMNINTINRLRIEPVKPSDVKQEDPIPERSSNDAF